MAGKMGINMDQSSTMGFFGDFGMKF